MVPDKFPSSFWTSGPEVLKHAALAEAQAGAFAERSRGVGGGCRRGPGIYAAAREFDPRGSLVVPRREHERAVARVNHKLSSSFSSLSGTAGGS
jgi:hypothetical protein